MSRFLDIFAWIWVIGLGTALIVMMLGLIISTGYYEVFLWMGGFLITVWAFFRTDGFRKRRTE